MFFSIGGFSDTNLVGQAEDGMRLSTGAGTQIYPNDRWGYERIEALFGIAKDDIIARDPTNPALSVQGWPETQIQCFNFIPPITK